MSSASCSEEERVEEGTLCSGPGEGSRDIGWICVNADLRRDASFSLPLLSFSFSRVLFLVLYVSRSLCFFLFLPHYESKHRDIPHREDNLTSDVAKRNGFTVLKRRANQSSLCQPRSRNNRNEK